MTNNYQSFRFSIVANRTNPCGAAIGGFAVLFVLILTSLSLQAQNYTVTTTTDGPSSGTTVTLRGALAAADALGGTHTINVPAGTYNLTLGTIAFGTKAQTITIQGTGGIATINMAGTGSSRSRIFTINYDLNSGVNTNLKNLSFTNGYASGSLYAEGGGAILCGGPNNIIDINTCTFQNNTFDPSIGSGGGAINCLDGTLRVANSIFTANTDAGSAISPVRAGQGGAILYYNDGVYTSPTSLSIVNSQFDNNSAGTSNSTVGGSGGALYIVNAAANSSFTILQNSFTANKALSTTTNTNGGGIYLSTNPTSTTISYNRFFGNAANLGSALYVYNTGTPVNAINNWWGCNNGPTACSDNFYSAPGSTASQTTPYLLIRTITANSSLCSGSSTGVTAGFTINSAGSTIPASSLSALTGVPISFSATLGTLSNAQTAIQPSGTATVTYTASNLNGVGTINPVVDNVPFNDLTARASIIINATPTITSQPTNASACAGTSTSFQVAASSGGGALSYQWYKGTTALTNGATGTGSTISGATSLTLAILNAGPSDAASNYNLRVSSTNGCSTTSVNASLVVNTVPVISTLPASGSSVKVGDNVRVAATVSGSATAYQWYQDGASVSGQTSATLNLTNVQLSQAGTYSLLASSGCGSANSSVFSLTVLGPDLSPIVYARPTLTYGPSSFSVVVDVVELNSVATTGSFGVRVTKDQKLSLSFDPVATRINNRSVQNSVWILDNSNANYYILTTSQPVPAGDKLSFGLSGNLLPGASTGVLTVSATVLPTTVVETRLNNNIDADKVEYFQQ